MNGVPNFGRHFSGSQVDSKPAVRQALGVDASEKNAKLSQGFTQIWFLMSVYWELSREPPVSPEFPEA